MARETIFEEQLQFLYDQVYGAYGSGISPAPFELVVGETYVISWDDEEHTRTAFAADSFSPGAVGLGNAAFIGGEADPDGLVFIIGYVPSENLTAILTISKDASHTVGVYKEVEAEASIILKDPLGNDAKYPQRGMIQLNTSDGGTVLYSKGQTLENVFFELDFSNGDQQVTAPDGYLVKSAVIVKPEDCEPENILKDKVIGGVVGTLESGGGGDGANTPAVFVQGATVMDYSHNANGQTSVGLSNYTFIPNNAQIIFEQLTSASQANTSAKSFAIRSQQTPGGAATGRVTVTDLANGKRRVNGDASVYASGAYALRYAYMFVAYTVPGISIMTTEENTILKANSTVTEWPGNYAAVVSYFDTLDLTESNIASVPDRAFSGHPVLSYVFLPATITKIGIYSFASEHPIVVDMTKHTVVPTLSSATGFTATEGLEIRIPSALYSSWIKATNWSTIADYIVAK